MQAQLELEDVGTMMCLLRQFLAATVDESGKRRKRGLITHL
jgi:hypothetical protein